ncbi:MAG: hypothetical protein KBF24_08570 [Thiobacillaceae bacterium]|jgi:hypothetical protein|nr:hypothetical protein [Hydrogenophilales bacterium]MBP8901093.1 hypothetical protein [Thiobacillaceae bacterium]MBP9916246.1 hypothetical protein [Thiobacillaceae bacterium]
MKSWEYVFYMFAPMGMADMCSTDLSDFRHFIIAMPETGEAMASLHASMITFAPPLLSWTDSTAPLPLAPPGLSGRGSACH